MTDTMNGTRTTKERAEELYRADPQITGSELGRQIGKSAAYGCRLVREFKAQGEPEPEAETDVDRFVRTLERTGADPRVVKAAQQPKPKPQPAPKPKTPVVLSAVPPRVRAAAQVATALVVVVAAVVSYEHQRHLAGMAGESPLAVWLVPLSVDGLIVVASASLMVRRRSHAGWRECVVPWSAVILGFVASLAANVLAADPTWIGRSVAAWPPIALFLAAEMMFRLTQESGTTTVP